VTTNPADVGDVISQDPPPGTLLEKGETVTITVGKSPKQVPVPNVVGMAEEDAKTAITDAGLKVGSVSTQPDPAPAGQVIDQNPSPGLTVDKGSTVDLIVSLGPEKVIVPDLTCMSYGRASSELSSRGLQIENAGEMPPSLACSKFGKVVAQDPEAFKEVDSGSTVKVWLVGETFPSPSPSFGGD
jgi:serine/threonine-protein kinase